MEQNGHKAQEQIAKLWGEEVTQQNVRDAVKKLRITGKKLMSPLLSTITGIFRILARSRQG